MTEESPRDVDTSIQVHEYSDKAFRVVGDYNTYHKVMKKFSARWNSRLKTGPGWIVPLEFKQAFDVYFRLDDAQSPRYKNVSKKDTRRETKKYNSDNEDEPPSNSRRRKSRETRDSPKETRESSRETRESTREPRRNSRETRSREELKVVKDLEPLQSSRSTLREIEAKQPVVDAKANISRMSVVQSVNDFVPEDQDIVSLSRRMRDIMARLDSIEKRK